MEELKCYDFSKIVSIGTRVESYQKRELKAFRKCEARKDCARGISTYHVHPNSIVFVKHVIEDMKIRAKTK
jgi:hypothetical protein